MFHVNIMPIATCFPYVFTCFPTFSGTNLLTRCQVPVPCFLLFLVSKICSGNILGIGPHEDRSPYFPQKHPEVRRRVEDGPRGALTMPRRAPPCPRLGVVRWPRSPPDIAISPIYTPPVENPKYLIRNPRKVPQPPSSSTLDQGVLKLSPAHCRRVDHHRRPLHHHACHRSDA